jgi:hypothetical protein
VLPDLDIQHALAEPAPEDVEAAARRYAVMAIGTMVKFVSPFSPPAIIHGCRAKYFAECACQLGS